MEVKIETSENTKELVILQGEALKPREKDRVNLAGSISAPRIYLEKRAAKKETDYILFSRDKMQIIFRQNENDQLGSIVTGKLSINPDLKKFNINSDSNTLSTKEMASLLKRNRFFFTDKDKNFEVVAALNSFNAKIETELNKEQDNKGNKRDLIEKKVVANIPSDFNLTMPIFTGQSTKTFNVEIAFDATDNGVRCWLESSDLQELILRNRDEIMNLEIEEIAKVCPMPIIEE